MPEGEDDRGEILLWIHARDVARRFLDLRHLHHAFSSSVREQMRGFKPNPLIRFKYFWWTKAHRMSQEENT